MRVIAFETAYSPNLSKVFIVILCSLKWNLFTTIYDISSRLIQDQTNPCIQHDMMSQCWFNVGPVSQVRCYCLLTFHVRTAIVRKDKHNYKRV